MRPTLISMTLSVSLILLGGCGQQNASQPHKPKGLVARFTNTVMHVSRRPSTVGTTTIRLYSPESSPSDHGCVGFSEEGKLVYSIYWEFVGSTHHLVHGGDVYVLDIEVATEDGERQEITKAFMFCRKKLEVFSEHGITITVESGNDGS